MNRLLFALALIALAAPLAAQEETIGVPVGFSVQGPIPVQDVDGNAVNLADYIGKKPAVVEFWATWCALCSKLMPQFETAKAKHRETVEILIVAVGVGQSRASVKRHVAEHAMPGRVFFDATGAATRAFEAPSTSYVVSIDAKGKVTYTGLGDKQTIEVAVSRAVEGGKGR